jgi:hypothetical protein
MQLRAIIDCHNESFKQVNNVHHTIQRALVFNKHWREVKNIVDNCFKILKKNFGKLFLKTDLQFIFFFNVIICCDIFYNIQFLMVGIWAFRL